MAERDVPVGIPRDLYEQLVTAAGGSGKVRKWVHRTLREALPAERLPSGTRVVRRACQHTKLAPHNPLRCFDCGARLQGGKWVGGG